MQLKQARAEWNYNVLALGGAILWLLLLPLPLGEGVLSLISKLLLLVIVVFAPLLLSLIHARLRLFQTLAAMAVVFSFILRRGSVGTMEGMLAAVWFLFTLLLALGWVRRLLPWHWPGVEELAIS